MSCYVFSNLVVTAGMLTPGLGVSKTPLSFVVQEPKLISLDRWHSSLANRQPIAQRRN